MATAKPVSAPELIPPDETGLVETEEPGRWEAITRAEIDSQVATAKKYPRSLSEFKRKVLEMATLDKDTAKECWYALPRAGKLIEGPSIRFAEIVAVSYKNLRCASRLISVGDDFLTSQAACMDLENNIGFQVETRRRITTKDGRRYDDDMINTTANANASISLRNAIFRVVPKAIYKSVLDAVKSIAMGDGRTLTETRNALLLHFKTLGVELPALLSFLETHTGTPHKGAEDVTLQDVTDLRGVATAIKDGQATVKDILGAQPVVQGAIPASALGKGDPATHQGPSQAPGKKAKLPGLAELRAQVVTACEKAKADGKDVDAIVFGCGIDNIDQCKDAEVLARAIGELGR
jgi:hypothetical protein